MSTFSHFAVKKLYFKRSLNNINGNRGPLFSQINSDQTFWEGVCPGGVSTGFLSGGVSTGFLSGGFWHRGLCPRTVSSDSIQQACRISFDVIHLYNVPIHSLDTYHQNTVTLTRLKMLQYRVHKPISCRKH